MVHNMILSQSLRSVFGTAAFLGVVLMLPSSLAAAPAAANGIWGAKDAVLTIGAHQSRIEWGHAEAAIDGPINTDAKGRFKSTARYHAYTPGPDRVGTAPAMRDAHIEGRFIGDTIEMTLHIVGDKAIQRYTFKKGQQTKLHRMM